MNLNEADISVVASEAKRGSLDTVICYGISINEAREEDLCILWRSTRLGWKIVQGFDNTNSGTNTISYQKSLGEELPNSILLEKTV